MRIFEIADAEAQLSLWKLVNDSVWTAIQTQQHEQAKQKAAAQQQKKAKCSTKCISKRSMSVPVPPPKAPYPPTTAATPNTKVANVAKQVSDVEDNDAASAQPTQSKRVPTLPTKHALLAQKKGITAFKHA